MAQLCPELSTIRQTGAELVVVGNGSVRYANIFREDMKLDAPLYVDPTLKTYQTIGFKRSIWRTIGPPAWRHAFRAFRSGFRQKGVKGDPWQEGGVLIVMPDGKVPYSYMSEAAGDHPAVKDVISALKAAMVGR